jgi:hypothetical protein
LCLKSDFKSKVHRGPLNLTKHSLTNVTLKILLAAVNQGDVLLQISTVFELGRALGALDVADIAVNDFVDSQPLSIRKALPAVVTLHHVVLVRTGAMPIELVFVGKLFATLFASVPGENRRTINHRTIQAKIPLTTHFSCGFSCTAI